MWPSAMCAATGELPVKRKGSLDELLSTVLTIFSPEEHGISILQHFRCKETMAQYVSKILLSPPMMSWARAR